MVTVAMRRLVTAAGGLSLVAASGATSWLRCVGFSLQWLLLWVQQLQLKGLVAPRHVESSQTRDQTCVPCFDRCILNPWASREV